MSGLEKAQLGAIRRCDGMGEAADDGDYVLMTIEPERQRVWAFRISIGQAALLIDELRGCLSAAGKGRDVSAPTKPKCLITGALAGSPEACGDCDRGSDT